MMSRTFAASTLLALLLGAMTAGGWAGDPPAHADRKVTIDAVPPLVKSAIMAGLEGGTVKTITQSESDGKAIFIVQLTRKDGAAAKKVFCDQGIELHEVGEAAKPGKPAAK